MGFDAEKVKKDIVEWIKDWFEENGKGCKAVVGLSGGKDSSVVAALCVEALGRDRVLGVMMPNGEQFDIDVSHKLAEHLGIESIVINIKDAYDGMLGELAKHFDSFEGQAKINLPPRLRMSALYAVSQTVNGRVANTCNLSEDWVGYATKYRRSKLLEELRDCLICSWTRYLSMVSAARQMKTIWASHMQFWIAISEKVSARTRRQKRRSTGCTRPTCSSSS